MLKEIISHKYNFGKSEFDKWDTKFYETRILISKPEKYFNKKTINSPWMEKRKQVTYEQWAIPKVNK